MAIRSGAHALPAPRCSLVPLTPTSADTPRLAINAEWFAKLRWVAAIGQLAVILFVTGPLGIEAPVGPLLLLVGVTILSNTAFWWWRSRRKNSSGYGLWLIALMLLDLMVLTAMLWLTGGPTNPFVVFYFVNLALSGVLLSARGAWLLSVAAIMAFALLTYTHKPIAELQDTKRLESLSVLEETGSNVPLALMGAWVAFAASAAVIVNFATRLTAEARASDRLRRLAEQQRAQSEKLEALGTLAAGAAHELATPLTTIAIAASETLRDLEHSGVAAESLADLVLIRSELERCRAILNRMSTKAGQATPGSVETFTAKELIDEVLSELTDSSRVDQHWPKIQGENAKNLSLFAPRTALAQALRAVVQNAIDATDDFTGRVTVRVDSWESGLRIRIEDQGPGMPPEVLSRASEPFFTTKEPGRGMGLGLFLTRGVVERLGGSFRLESPFQEGAVGGTLATIVLPLAK